MTLDYIISCTDLLKEKYNILDPFYLVKALNILLLKEPLGYGEDSCKGLFMICFDQPVIIINANMNLNAQKIVLFHEIGHAILHKDLIPVMKFEECNLFSYGSTEREANIFASELILSDEIVMEALGEYPFFDAAKLLSVPPEILGFKLIVMKEKELIDCEIPMIPKDTFYKYDFF